MLPPILEIYVVWHPADIAGQRIASEIFEHYHGTTFSGLLGGAIEVYMRSAGWMSATDSPRPIQFPETTSVSGVPAARFAAIVPIIGNEFASVIEAGPGPWSEYVAAILAAHRLHSNQVGVFPLIVDRGAMDGTALCGLFGSFQRIASPSPSAPSEPARELVCRDLSQGIAQMIRPGRDRLTVFISHTKRSGAGEADTPAIISLVREIIADTRLKHFFDASDLQPGEDWDAELRTQASKSALLVLRTDLYASREWCQREMLIAKRHGMPVVTLDCVSVAEERGSFLMDHVPRIPVRKTPLGWTREDARRGLNLLVDECLKRELWLVQQQLANGRPDLAVAWWAPHAPEPVTLLQWLEDGLKTGQLHKHSGLIRILHPDPPLGPDETATLQQIVEIVGRGGPLEVLTPRMLAARGA